MRARPEGPRTQGQLRGWWLKGEMCQCGASLPSPQGNQLRKMLLQNYLQNRKSSSRGDLPDPMGTGQYCLLATGPLGGPPFCSPAPRPLTWVPQLQAWTKTGRRLRPPSAGWTRRGPPSWYVT